MRRLGHQTVDLLVDYLTELGETRVAKRGTADELNPLVDEPLPRQGRGAEESLALLFGRILPATPKVSHPRFHAYIPSPGSFYATLGEMAASAANPFVGSWLGGGAMAALELVTIRWIAEAVSFPVQAAGIFTSGGSMANLSAIAAARQRDGAANDVLYFSEQGHGSATKAAMVLGYPEDALRRVPTDSTFRLRPDILRDMIHEDRAAGRHPLLVCANAGTTSTGAIDPLGAIADVCQSEALWFHVDAAYGGFAAICSDGRRRLADMDRADSLTLDPHKWLYCPMGIGCLLVKDRGALEGAFRADGDYLKNVPRNEVNFFDRGPELSRPARVLPVWMLLRSAGLGALAEQVEFDLELARTAERLLADIQGLEIVTPAQLSIVTFRHSLGTGEGEAERAARDQSLMERTLEGGVVMISGTDLEGRSALRFVVQNHRTTEAELTRSVAEIARVSRELQQA